MFTARDPYWWKKAAQERLTRLSGGRIMVFEGAKHGISDTADIARAVGTLRTIVDVGANIGQSAIRFRAAFPDARIISIEPIAETFEQLRKKTAALGVESHRLALGSSAGTATMYLTPFSATNSLVKPDKDELLGTEEVSVDTVDNFASAQGLDRIDLLKVDAEGFDLEVVKGATALLESGRIGFVMVEVGLHPGDDRHPLFDDVRGLLMPYGFRLFGLYGQNLEWTGEPAMRFANALFCCAQGWPSRVFDVRSDSIGRIG